MLAPIRIHQQFNATPEQIYAAWTQADILSRWFFPKHSWSCFVVNDLKPGGLFHCEMTNTEGFVHTFKGTYRQLDFPRAIAFTWSSLIIDNSMVRVLLEPVDGGTLLTLTHDGLKSSEAVQYHIAGWTGCLDQLNQMVALGMG